MALLCIGLLCDLALVSLMRQWPSASTSTACLPVCAAGKHTPFGMQVMSGDVGAAPQSCSSSCVLLFWIDEPLPPHQHFMMK